MLQQESGWSRVGLTMLLVMILAFPAIGCNEEFGGALTNGDGSGNGSGNGPITGAAFYQFGFEDGSPGRFENGSGQDPRVDGWQIDDSDAAEGSFSLWWNFDTNGGGSWFFYLLNHEDESPGRAFYVGFHYKLSADWQHRSNDQSKIVRFKEGFIGGNAGSLIWDRGTGDAELKHFWDGFAGQVGQRPCNVAGPCLETEFLDTWHWVELYQDVSDPTRAVARMWIDDDLRLEYIDDISATYDGETWGSFEFDGSHEIEAGQEFFDLIAISTEKIR